VQRKTKAVRIRKGMKLRVRKDLLVGRNDSYMSGSVS